MTDKLIDFGLDVAKEASKTVGRLSKKTVLVLTSIFVLMAYWFIAIFLISPQFYNQTDVWITIIFCFVFSINWYIVNIGLSSFITALIEEIFPNEQTNINDILVIGSIQSILYLSASLFGCYYFHTTFFAFLLISYSYILIRISILGLFLIKSKLRKTKEIKEIMRQIDQE